MGTNARELYMIRMQLGDMHLGRALPQYLADNTTINPFSKYEKECMGSVYA